MHSRVCKQVVLGVLGTGPAVVSGVEELDDLLSPETLESVDFDDLDSPETLESDESEDLAFSFELSVLSSEDDSDSLEDSRLEARAEICSGVQLMVVIANILDKTISLNFFILSVHSGLII